MRPQHSQARAEALAARATVAIITALPKELAAMEAMLDHPVDHSTPGRAPGEYVLGEVPSKEGGTHAVVAVCSSAGEDLAAAHLSVLLERFPKIESVLMVGIAGAAPDTSKSEHDVRLCDIVVSDSSGVKQYDFDKETFKDGVLKKEPRFPPRPPGARLLSAAAELERLELNGIRPWEAHLRRGKKLKWTRLPTAPDELHSTTDPTQIVMRLNDPNRRPKKPMVFRGPIASANKLLKNAKLRDELRETYGVKAVEMEAAGVADAAWLASVGYLVVRGTCDYCDEYKCDPWQGRAALVAAAYARAVLERTRSADPTPSNCAITGFEAAPGRNEHESKQNCSNDVRTVEHVDSAPHDINGFWKVGLDIHEQAPEGGRCWALSSRSVGNNEQQPAGEAHYPIPQNFPRQRARNFVGRDGALHELITRLDADPAGVVAAWGMAGAGKTELVLQFITKAIGSFGGGVLWLDGRSSIGFSAQVLQFARDVLRIAVAEEANDTALPSVWNQWPGVDPVLIVFDSAEDRYGEVLGALKGADASRFRSIVTSRERPPPTIQALFVDVLSEDDAVVLFVANAGRNSALDENATVAEICQAVGCLPLAVELVSCYLFTHPSLDEKTVKARLETQGAQARMLDAAQPGMTAKVGVEAAIMMTWADTPEAARRVASKIAAFAASGVSRQLLLEVFAEHNPDDLEEYLDDQLIRTSLARLEGDRVWFHPLVRDFVRRRSERQRWISDDQAKLARAAIVWCRQIPDSVPAVQRNWFRERVDHVALVSTTSFDVIDEQEWYWPFVALSRYFLSNTMPRDAIEWARRGAEVCGNKLGDAHSTTLTAMNNLGVTLHSAGHLAEALEIHKVVLRSRTDQLGEEAPATLTSMSNIVSVLEAMGNLDAAVSLCRRVVNSRQAVLGELNPKTLSSMDRLATLLVKQGELQEAERLFNKVLPVRRVVLGQVHPDTLSSINNWGNLLRTLGHRAQARRLQEEAVAACCSILGEDNPQTLMMRSNLALLMREEGDISSARSLAQSILDVRREKLGPDHPSVIESMHMLISLVRDDGDEGQAQRLGTEALAIARNKLGSQHPTTISIMHELAVTMSARGELSDSRALLEEELPILRRVRGNMHAATMNAAVCLGAVLWAQKDYAAAASLEREACAYYSEVFGHNHPDTLNCKQNLAKTLRLMGEKDDADELERAVLKASACAREPRSE